MEKTERAEIRLREWEEVTGTFRGFMREDFSVAVLFDYFQLIFNSESIEAQIVEEKLGKVLVGEKIAILRTDLQFQPLVIRIDGERAGDQKSGSQNENRNFKG